jgi:uncharacterized OsmC-like protein
MHPFPHHYMVKGIVRPYGDAELTAEGVTVIESSPPKEFGGEGIRWSPEGLLTAAIADCLALNFRAIATASRFEWKSLEVTTQGTLDRVAGKMQFTGFNSHAKLLVPPGANAERAEQLLEKAEATCPISNTLNCTRSLIVEIIVDAAHS